jgi:protein transport protein SEC24
VHTPHLQVVYLLESIPRLFAGSQVQETCGGAALRAAVEALAGGEGGRVHAFICSLPRRGTLHLRLRDVGRPPTDRDNLDSLLPESKEYAALAAHAADHQVSIDLFLLAQGYVDAATLGTLSAGTAGSLHHWAPWDAALDADELLNELRRALVRPQVGQGWQAFSTLVADVQVLLHLIPADQWAASWHRQ